jgi:hypothetical protein
VSTTKRKRATRGRKTAEYDDEGVLRAAVLDYCVAEWKNLTGVDWTPENGRQSEEILGAYRSAVDAYKGLVASIDAASRIVERYPKDAPDTPDFRVDFLRSFFESLSQETRSWVNAHRKARDERWFTDENSRARIAHWQLALGLPSDAHHLAVLSLLVGHWPLGVVRGTVAAVVDKERHAMANVLQRIGQRVPVLVKMHAARDGASSRRRGR